MEGPDRLFYQGKLLRSDYSLHNLPDYCKALFDADGGAERDWVQASPSLDSLLHDAFPTTSFPRFYKLFYYTIQSLERDNRHDLAELAKHLLDEIEIEWRSLSSTPTFGHLFSRNSALARKFALDSI